MKSSNSANLKLISPPESYNFAVARALCESAGLIFDERQIPLAEDAFRAAKLTQHQADEMFGLHVELVAWMANRKNYSILQRLGIALHFLGFGKDLGYAARRTANL